MLDLSLNLWTPLAQVQKKDNLNNKTLIYTKKLVKFYKIQRILSYIIYEVENVRREAHNEVGE